MEPKTLSEDALHALTAFDWPGNVRQLINATRRLTVTAPGREIRLEDIPGDLGGADVPCTTSGWSQELEAWAQKRLAGGYEAPLLHAALPELERTLMRVALAKCGGRRQDAAKLLGWGRNTLTRKLRELGMEGGE